MAHPVDACDTAAKTKLDILIRPKLLRPDHDPLKRLVAGEIFLGQRRALIGRVGLAPDHHDRALMPLLTQRNRCLSTAMASANDHDVSRRRRMSRVAHGQSRSPKILSLVKQ